MTKDEKLRQINLLIEFNGDSRLLELLDLVGQEYADTIVDRIDKGNTYKTVAIMQAGVRALRNALTQDIEVLNKTYKEIKKEGE